MSLVEAIANNAISFVVSVIANFYLLPFVGMNPTFSQSIMMTVIFSVISIVRSYYLRRFFEWIGALHRELVEMKTLT